MGIVSFQELPLRYSTHHFYGFIYRFIGQYRSPSCSPGPCRPGRSSLAWRPGELRSKAPDMRPPPDRRESPEQCPAAKHTALYRSVTTAKACFNILHSIPGWHRSPTETARESWFDPVCWRVSTGSRKSEELCFTQSIAFETICHTPSQSKQTWQETGQEFDEDFSPTLTRMKTKSRWRPVWRLESLDLNRIAQHFWENDPNWLMPHIYAQPHVIQLNAL